MLQSAEQKVHEYASYLDSWKCVWEAAIEKHGSKSAVCSAGIDNVDKDFLVNIAKEGAVIQCCSLRGGQVPAEIVAYADATAQLESLPVLRLHSYTAPFWCRGDHLSHVSKLTWHSILAAWNAGNQLSSVKAADQFVPPDVLFHLNSLLAFCKEHGLQLSSCRIGDVPTRHSQEVQVDEAVRFVFCRSYEQEKKGGSKSRSHPRREHLSACLKQ